VADAPPAVAPATDPAPETHTALPCPTDVKNHGAYVSQVAHDDSVKGREHGKAVSEAAKSDCGKPAGEDAEAADTEDTDAPEVEATEAPEAPDGDDADEAGDTQRAEKHGKSHRRS
jgi:hypothetical protein